MKTLYFLILIAINLHHINAQDIKYNSSFIDSLEIHYLLETSYGNYFTDDSLVFKEFNLGNTFSGANRLISPWHARYGLGLLFHPLGDLTDINLKLGGSYAPFLSILYLNLDLDLSYGYIILNNFSGTIKPSLTLHIPFYRIENEFNNLVRLNFVASVGIYHRFSHKIIGYLGNDNFYKNTNGYNIQFGIALEFRGKLIED